MQRGEFKQHTYSYVMESGEMKNYGLVCWKDRDIVYCLTNSIATEGNGSCFRRTSTGRVCIERPLVIGEYNKYMGGVDLADQRWLHSNSTIMGQHRWWLKLFFYLLDVGTANSLILYKIAMSGKKDLTISEYKRKLVMALVGSRLELVAKPVNLVHELIWADRRHICVHCSLMSVTKRTRYVCAAEGCRLPLCSVGNGKSATDCFASVDRSEEVRQMAVARHWMQLLKTNKNKNNSFYVL
jgi:Transposase IS4